MNIIFPASYEGNIDSFWEKEMEAAKKAGFGISLVSGTHFGGPVSISNRKDKSYMYRGWIVKPQAYQEMTEALNQPMLNSMDDYLWSFEFPRWYNEIVKYTPHSVWYLADEVVNLGLDFIVQEIANDVSTRESNSLIVKDFLKSRKHEWFDACFIRDRKDEKEVLRILSNFFKLQGRDFYGGLVFREFLNLKQLGIHPKSRMPLPVEFRTFFLKGEPIFTVPYWDNDVPYTEEVSSPPEDWLISIGQKLKSPFVALDIAQDTAGKWWVIEVNDGGSAGLPERAKLEDFYKILFEKMK